MNAILKAHSSAWLDSKVYRLAWLVGPLAVVMLVFGSLFWISPSNALRIFSMPVAYTAQEQEAIRAGLKANDPATLQRLLDAAEDSDPRALSFLGLLYDPTAQFASGVTRNFNTALGHYEKAIALGSVRALINAGYMLEQSGQKDQACKYFAEAFKKEPDLPEAMANAGYCMAIEKDVSPAKKAAAIELLLSAAKGGYVRAYSSLGYLHVSSDIKEAVRFYERAVAENVDDGGYSNTELGEIYLQGYAGIPVDLKKALQYFLKGYEQGSAKSAVELSMIYSTGNNFVPIDYVKSFQYASFAAKMGQPMGHYNVSLNYFYGQGTQRNYERAAVHALTAISLGNDNAMQLFKLNSLAGDFVRIIQRKLAGVYTGPVDGRMNPVLIQSLESIKNSRRTFE
jgi:TPR repeat protein